jgi:hypothetical protein
VIFSYKGTFSRTFTEKLKKNIFGHHRVKTDLPGGGEGVENLIVKWQVHSIRTALKLYCLIAQG